MNNTKAKALNYVFHVSFLSAKNDGSWTPVRFTIYRRNEGKGNERTIAGEIADANLKIGEGGVRVQFKGLKETGSNIVTPMNNFTLTILRDDGKSY